ncbi:MAG: uroporphyrinogen decarboxylase family protein [Brevefilum sp.]|nr:uroporphyrinogen decarboxylase family protein [Brevefilum sp.]
MHKQINATSLTSRERVQRAINHEETDRIPIDFGGMASTGIMAIAYDRLKKYLGVTSGQIRVYDIGQQLAEVEPEILARFGVDVISLENSLSEAQSGRWKPWTLPNGVACQVPVSMDLRPDEEQGGWLLYESEHPVRRMSPDSLYFSRIYHPLADAKTTADLNKYSHPVISDEKLDMLNMRAKNLYENTDYAIMANFGGSIYETCQGLRGWDQFLIDLATGGSFVEDLINRIVESQLRNLSRFLGAVGDYVQIIQFGDDLGMQDRTQISRRMYQNYIMPGHQALFQYVHQNSDCAVFLHSCGSVSPLIPDLIDAGVDILNPVQTSAANMDPVYLMKEFGDQITFWGGGCDTQHVLTNATPEEIEDHVIDRLKIFGPGGGFVFNQIHNIQANVPPENITAMFDTVLNFRQ